MELRGIPFAGRGLAMDRDRLSNSLLREKTDQLTQSIDCAKILL
jgi:hypothetical protein